MCKRDESYHTHEPKIEHEYRALKEGHLMVAYGDTRAVIRTRGPFRKNAAVRALAQAKLRHDEGTARYMKKRAKEARRWERAQRFQDEQVRRLQEAVENQGLVEPEKKKVTMGLDATESLVAAIEKAQIERARWQRTYQNPYGNSTNAEMTTWVDADGKHVAIPGT